MKKLSLRMKLGLGSGNLLLFLAAMGYLAYSSVGQLADMAARADEVMVKTNLASQVEAAMEKQSAAIRGFLLVGKEELLKRDEEGKQQFAESMDKLSKLLALEESKKLQTEIRQLYVPLRANSNREIELRRAGKLKEAEAIMFSPRMNEARGQIHRA